MNNRLPALIATHWRGELPVAVSVLAVLVGLSFLYNYVTTQFLSLLFLQQRYLLQLILLTLVMLMALPILIWQITGTWRSISKASSGPSKVGRLMGSVGHSLLIVFAALSAWQLLPRFADLGQALVTIAHASEKYAISSPYGNARRLKFSGELAWGSSGHFEARLELGPEVDTLELDSPGGSLQEASRIATAVRARKLATFVSGECLSACTLVFSAGHPRIALSTAKFGFHRPTGSSIVSRDLENQMVQLYATMLLANGIDERFVMQATRIAPPQIWIPNKSDLRISKFVEQYVE